MNPGGFFIEELFQFDKKWYGVLRCEYHDDFMRIVKITRINNESIDWVSLNQTFEKIIEEFYFNDFKR